MLNRKLNSSVIIPFYNGKDFVFETIDSLKKQSRKADEIIIVDDGSDCEASKEILDKIEKEYSDINILHQKNKGISGAMNAGVKIAKGEILFQVDSDDILHGEYIEKYMAIFENDQSVDAVVSYYGAFLDGSDYLDEEKYKWIYRPKGLVMPDIFYTNCAGGANSAFRTDALAKVGYWDENWKSCQDWGLWLKFVEYNLKHVIIPEILYYYRVHDNSDTQKGWDKTLLNNNIKQAMYKIADKRPEAVAKAFYESLEKCKNKNSAQRNKKTFSQKMREQFVIIKKRFFPKKWF